MKRIESDNPQRQAVNDRIDTRIRRTNRLRRTMVATGLGLGALFGVTANDGSTAEAVATIGTFSVAIGGGVAGAIDGRRLKRFVRAEVADYAGETVGNRYEDGTITRTLSVTEDGGFREDLQPNMPVLMNRHLASSAVSSNALPTPFAVFGANLGGRLYDGSLNLELPSDTLAVTAMTASLVGGAVLFGEFAAHSIRNDAQTTLDAIDNGGLRFQA